MLRLGGNTDRQRERVVAAFEKQKTTAEIAEILKALYHGGNGLGSVSAWYAEDGIHPVSYTHLDVYKRQGLIYDSQAPPRRRYVRQKTEAQKFREDRQRCYRVLSDYYHLLKKWGIDHSPRTPEEEPHPRFVEAIQKKTYVEYLLDLFLYESEEEQKAWIAEHTAEITHLERLSLIHI